MIPPALRRPFVIRAAFGLFCVYALYRFLHAAWIDSMDFNVYWRTAQIWINSAAPPYEVRPEDRGFVLKQPPWILPFFAPFGFLGMGVSRLLWAAVELACVAVTLRWLKRAGVSSSALFWTFVAFWWLWLAHFFAGQLNLVLLAAALLAFPAGGAKAHPLAKPFLPIVYSFKLFPLITLVGRWSELVRPKIVAASIGILIALNGAIWLREAARPGVGAGEAVGRVAAIYRDWPKAAASGGTELGEEIIRGPGNHGLTAGVLRWSGIPATQVKADIYVAFAVALVLSLAWFAASRSLDADEQWAGWIAVGLLCHPLVWHHVFVLAFPIAALAADRASRSKRRAPRIMAWAGIFLIALCIQELWGPEWVTRIERASSKAWGVVLCAWALILSSKSPKPGFERA